MGKVGSGVGWKFVVLVCVRCSLAVWYNRVWSQWEEGIVPLGLMQGSERGWRDWISTVVRQVSDQGSPGTRPETGGGVMVML